MCLVRYISNYFDLFPHMITNHLLVRERHDWEEELNMNIHMRMSHVVNEEYYNIWFARTTKEIIWVQIFFDFFKKLF